MFKLKIAPLFGLAVSAGCLIVFTFPNWSSGTVRNVKNADEFVIPRIVIESKQHTLTLDMPGKDPVVMKAQGAYLIKAGAHAVVSKERNPLWKAPPTYFLRRGLAVPSENAPERSMRGALGAQALFLEGGLAIHSGLVWNEDVGGIKVSAQDMTFLFEAVRVGAAVEVR